MTTFKLQLSRDRAQNYRTPPAVGRFRRTKTVIGALLGTSAVIGFMFAALLLGSVIATFLVILVVVAITVASIKLIIRHFRGKRVTSGLSQ